MFWKLKEQYGLGAYVKCKKIYHNISIYIYVFKIRIILTQKQRFIFFNFSKSNDYLNDKQMGRSKMFVFD